MSFNKHIFLFILTFFCAESNAQSVITGHVIDLADSTFLDNVNVRNIHTMKGMAIHSNGRFEIEVSKGDLIEFSKIGYQTVRIRITNEKEPAYYNIVMNKAPILLREVDIRGKPLDYKKDSIRYRETYDLVLRKEKRNEIDFRSMPLAMLSKKNRQEWAFQEMYEIWEREKFIDFTFNERLVARITYLKDDELKEFMKKFRPSYQFLRTASEYEYLNYIKSSYFQFKRD